MISVNGTLVAMGAFPDKTSAMRYNPNDDGYTITWKYDGDHECMALWYLVHHIRENCGAYTPIHLNMPYLPNARMDRVKNFDEVFTLKWFAKFINCMNFDSVEVFDVHSNVSEALVDHILSRSAHDCVEWVIDTLGAKGLNPLLCFPDEGACKRYAPLFPHQDYTFCKKHRDWRSGKIEGMELGTPEKVADRNILIVDDICSRGGTFVHAAELLKDVGAKEIFLYVSHCEDTIFRGSILTDGLISHVFTTDSIFHGDHDKITVVGKEIV